MHVTYLEKPGSIYRGYSRAGMYVFLSRSCIFRPHHKPTVCLSFTREKEGLVDVFETKPLARRHQTNVETLHAVRASPRGAVNEKGGQNSCLEQIFPFTGIRNAQSSGIACQAKFRYPITCPGFDDQRAKRCGPAFLLGKLLIARWRWDDPCLFPCNTATRLCLDEKSHW